jgi:hypothetical protein
MRNARTMGNGFAADTKVSIPKSKAEIEEFLNRRGIDEVACPSMRGTANVIFVKENQTYRMSLKLPEQEVFRFTEARRRRDDAAMREAWNQGCKAVWRRLLLLLKAKFIILAENPDAAFQSEFLAYRLLPNCETVEEHVLPQMLQLPSPSMQVATCLPQTGAVEDEGQQQ